MLKKIFNFCLFLTLFSTPIYAQEIYKIATGSITGNYYPTGGAIARMVNKYQKSTKITFVNEQTNGSIDNIEKLKQKKAQFILVQSNIAKKYHDKEFTSLKAVMAIYPELLTFIVKKESNIHSIHELKGKKIFIGEEKSGTEETVTTLFKELNLPLPKRQEQNSIKMSHIQNALNNNLIDGYFYMVGHPTANITNIANAMDVKLIAFDDKSINTFIAENRDYVKGFIPANIYKGNDKAISSFGLKTLLVTTEDMSNDVVYLVVKSVLRNFDEFKKLHPAYKNITKKSLLEGLLIPLHNGAKKYYKEAKLL
ncbi:MAG: TAXI family TRAP transporter solute-binding subunit [Candidatus Marinarcus sp.]|uniref:TAXI family TRAP transporter solute-binding subunit n=1 Tax=Candidatus Marinarcus sp. TaxID=3100987 RepID=UPI003B00FE25